jgi:hypothetical protein
LSGKGRESVEADNNVIGSLIMSSSSNQCITPTYMRSMDKTFAHPSINTTHSYLHIHVVDRLDDKLLGLYRYTESIYLYNRSRSIGTNDVLSASRTYGCMSMVGKKGAPFPWYFGWFFHYPRIETDGSYILALLRLR